MQAKRALMKDGALSCSSSAVEELATYITTLSEDFDKQLLEVDRRAGEARK